jgi:Zn-dependent protease with chaperone function
MHAGTWADVAAQSIVHGFVAAVVVEALIRLWRVQAPDERLGLRLLAAGGPLVLSPALVLGWPERSGDEFRLQFAVFTARHWEDVAVLGVPVFHVWLAALAACGAALLLMDLRPLLSSARRRSPAAAAAPPPWLPATVEALARPLGVRPPPVRFLDLPVPVLFCTGVRRPAIVISRGTVALLDREELAGALAHELAHLAARDPAVSWLLMALRAALFFNPAVQVVARAMARDAEARADERAGAAGDRLALASALLKLYRATHGRTPPAVRRTLPLAGALAEPFRRARTLDVESRCRRLLEPGPAPRRPLAAARVALAAGGLALLLVVIA